MSDNNTFIIKPGQTLRLSLAYLQGPTGSLPLNINGYTLNLASSDLPTNVVPTITDANNGKGEFFIPSSFTSTMIHGVMYGFQFRLTSPGGDIRIDDAVFLTYR